MEEENPLINEALGLNDFADEKQIEDQLKQLEKMGSVDIRNLAAPDPAFKEKYPLSNLSRPGLNQLRKQANQVEAFKDNSDSRDYVREGADNSFNNKKILNIKGELVDWDVEGWQNSNFSYLGYNNVLYERPIEGTGNIISKSNDSFSRLTGGFNPADGLLDQFDSDRQYEYLVPAFDKDGTPYLKVVHGTRAEMEEKGVQTLSKFGIPEKSDNAAYALVAGLANTLGQTDDLVLGAAKLVQDAGVLPYEAITGEEVETGLDKVHRAALLDTKQTDLLLSDDANQFGTLEWLAAGTGSAFGSLMQFGGVGRAARGTVSIGEALLSIGKTGASQAEKTLLAQAAKRSIADKAASYGASGVVGFGYGYNEAIQSGLPEGDAWVYGLLVGGINSAIELAVGPSFDKYLTGGGPKVIAKEILKEIDPTDLTKSSQSWIKSRGSKFVSTVGTRFKNALNEGGEEIAQDVVEQGAKIVYDNFLKNEDQEGFGHTSYDYLQTVASGIFGAIAATPFNQVRTTMRQRILNGEGKDVDVALDQLKVTGKISDLQYKKLKTDKEYFERTAELDKDIVSKLSGEYQRALMMDVGELISKKSDFLQEKDKLTEGLSDNPDPLIKKKADEAKVKIEQINKQIELIETQLNNYRNPAFLKQRVQEFDKAKQAITEANGSLFNYLSLNSTQDISATQDDFVKRVGTLGPESFESAYVVRNPQEAAFAFKSLNEGKIKSDLQETIARDIADQKLYLSPLVNTMENRPVLLAMGITEDQLPLTKEEKAEAEVTPEKFAGRFIPSDQFQQLINTIDVAKLNAHFGDQRNAKQYTPFERIKYLTETRDGVTDAMLASLDNREVLKDLLKPEQHTAIEKLLNYALPASVYISNDISSEETGGFQPESRFLYVSGLANKLRAQKNKNTPYYSKLQNKLFRVLAHETGHSLFDRELERMHVGWQNAMLNVTDTKSVDFKFFNRLYSLAKLSHSALKDDAKYQKSYFYQVMEDHLKLIADPDVKREEKTAAALLPVKEFYAEAMGNTQFQEQLDSFNINDPKNKQIVTSSGYNYSNPIAKVKSLLGEVLDSIASVFHKLRDVLTKADRTLLTEAFILGSELEYNRYIPPTAYADGVVRTVDQSVVSAYAPVNLYNDDDIHNAQVLRDTLVSRIESQQDKSQRTLIPNKKSFLEGLHKHVIVPMNDPESPYISGTAKVVFFKNTEDIMVFWQSEDGEGGEINHRVFLTKWGSLTHINTDIKNIGAPTTLSKMKFQTVFSNPIADKQHDFNREVLNNFDRAHKEGLNGEAWLELNEGHSWTLADKTLVGGVNVVYRFKDGSTGVIGFTPDLTKVRLSQYLNEGVRIGVTMEVTGTGSEAYVKRDENGRIVSAFPLTEKGLPGDYVREKGFLPGAIFRYNPEAKVSEEVSKYVDQVDPFTAQNDNLPINKGEEDFLTAHEILQKQVVLKKRIRNFSMYNSAFDDDKIGDYDPAKDKIDYARKGLKRALLRTLTWSIDSNLKSEKLVDEDIASIAIEFNREFAQPFLKDVVSEEDSLRLGFASDEEFVQFTEDVIYEMKRQFANDRNMAPEDWSGTGGNPSGRISMAIRADLESINYEYNNDKHWVDFSDARQFLFEASRNAQDFDAIMANLKRDIDNDIYAGRDLAIAKAIHNYLTAERDGDEKIVFESAKKSYWSQFASNVRVDALTIGPGTESAKLYFNGEKSYLNQLSGDVISNIAEKVNMIKDLAAAEGADPKEVFKREINAFFVDRYSEKLMQEGGFTQDQARQAAERFITTKSGTISSVHAMINSRHTMYSADDYRTEKFYNNKVEYDGLVALLDSYYAFFGIDVPSNAYKFQRNEGLFNSIQDYKEKKVKEGQNLANIKNDVLVRMKEKSLSMVNYIEATFTDSKTRLKGAYPFPMLATQMASWLNNEINKDLTGKDPDYKVSELTPFVKTVMRQSGNYRSPEFFHNVHWSKEYAIKRKSYTDSLIERLSNPADHLMSLYEKSELYKNNRFLQSLKESKDESFYMMLSGIDGINEDREGKTFMEALSMDYMYMNLAAFTHNYGSDYYYHADDVPSDKPKNMAYRMRRVKPAEVKGEIEKIIEVEKHRLREFNKRFNKAFEMAEEKGPKGEHLYRIVKGQEKAFNSLVPGVFFELVFEETEDKPALYKKGWAFDEKNLFYEGKDADGVIAMINFEADLSFKHYKKNGLNFPVPATFLKKVEGKPAKERLAAIEAEKERVYKEWFMNAAINRYHVSQVTMGDNIYYKPKDNVDLSKRHTNAPSNKPFFQDKQIKLLILEDVPATSGRIPGVATDATGKVSATGEEVDLSESTNKTDAQGYFTEEFAKANEEAFGVFSSYEKVFKPVVFGVSEKDIATGQPLYLKLSATVLPNPVNPENDAYYAQYPDRKSFAEKLYASGAQMAVFNTGVKAGATSLNKHTADQYNIVEFDSNLYGLQNNPNHSIDSDDDYLNGMVQMTKILGDNGNGHIMDEYHKIEGSIQLQNATDFFENEFSHPQKLKEAIHDELVRNEFSHPLANFIESDIQLLDNQITAKSSENFVNAKFKKRMALTRKDGAKLVNASDFMYSRPAWKKLDIARRSELLTSLNVNNQTVVTELQWAGPRRPEQLLITQLEELAQELENGTAIIYNGFVHEANGNVRIYPAEALVPPSSNYQIGDRMISTRIPTSKLSNITPAIVVGHVSPHEGNIIVLNEVGTAIHGYDFDVDGLFTWRERQHKEDPAIKRLFEIGWSVLTDPKNYGNMTSRTTTDGIKEIADRIDNLLGDRSSGKTKYNRFSPQRQIELKALNSVSKDMIGIAASFSGTHSVLEQNNGSAFEDVQYIDPATEQLKVIIRRGYLYNNTLKKRHERTVVDRNGQELLVTDLMSEIINAATDNAKLQILGRLNITHTTSPVVLDMISHGIDLEYALFFVNQPIMREYSRIEDLQNAASYTGEKVDLYLHLYDAVERRIQSLSPELAQYKFENSVSQFVGGDLTQADRIEISIGALEAGLKMQTESSLSDPIVAEKNRLETQLMVLDKFNFYRMQNAGSTKKAAALITLTSGYPKTFIELIDRFNDIEKGLKAVDMAALAFEHGSYSVHYAMLKELIERYSKFKLYANPEILGMHKELAEGRSVDLQQKVMEDFYVYLLQKHDVSDNDNFVYNLSTTSLTGEIIDPYIFVNETADLIKALKQAYPENQFLRIIQFQENIKSSEQRDDRAVKPNRIISRLQYEPDGQLLDQIRRDFLALPENVTIRYNGVSRNVPSTQDIVLGHLLHTQGFRMGGLSFSKVLPEKTGIAFDQVIQKWKDDFESFPVHALNEIGGFRMQVRLNNPELINRLSDEMLKRGIKTTRKHFEQWSTELLDKSATYDGAMRRKTLPDGGEEVSIMSDKSNEWNQQLISYIVGQGVIRMKDAAGKLREYTVEEMDLINIGKYKAKHIVLRTINFKAFPGLKQYSDDIFLGKKSNAAIEAKSYTPDLLETTEEPIEQEPGTEVVDNTLPIEVSESQILTGRQTGVTLDAMPLLEKDQIISIPTKEGGKIDARVAAAPYSIREMYNRFLSENMNEGERLIHEYDLFRFREEVKKKGGKKPNEFFTSNTFFKNFYNKEIGKREKNPDNSIWMINDLELYDLVDRETGEVLYYQNVDLLTGKSKFVNEDQLGELQDRFVRRWMEIEGITGDVEFNNIINKYQVRITVDEGPIDDAVKTRIRKGIEKIGAMEQLTDEEKSYLINKLQSAKTQGDVDAIADELIQRCK